MVNAIDASAMLATGRGRVAVAEVTPGDLVFDANGHLSPIIRASPVRENRSCYAVRFDSGEVIVVDERQTLLTESYLDRSTIGESEAGASSYRQGTDAEIARARVLAREAESAAFVTQTEAIRAMGWTTSRGGILVRHVARARIEFVRRGNTKLLRAEQLWSSLANYLELAVLARPTSATPRRRSLETIARTLVYAGTHNHGVRLAAPLTLPDAMLPIAPTVLGAWLSDLSRPTAPQGGTVAPIAVFARALSALGVDAAAHIPMPYLRASVVQRRELLAGLEMPGATTQGERVSLRVRGRRLAVDVCELVSTLGGRAHFVSEDTDADVTTSIWNVRFNALDAGDRASAGYRYIAGIESVLTRPLRHLEVAGAGTVLVGRACIAVDAAAASARG